MTRRSKALTITPAVRGHVRDRDQGRCVLCARIDGLQCAHYISRAQGGLGIARNLVMLCIRCHAAYDQSAERQAIREMLQDHLQSCYPDWDEQDLYYNKWEA